MWTFKVGDRVKRLKDVFNKNSPMLYGNVIAAYSETSRVLGIHYPELYSVRWDNREEEDGFLPHGLRRDEDK